MITPEYLADMMDEIEQSVSRMTQGLLLLIVRKMLKIFFKNGEVRFIPSDIKYFQMLVRAGLSIDDIRKEIEKMMPSIQSDVERAFINASAEINTYVHELDDFNQREPRNVNIEPQTAQGGQNTPPTPQPQPTSQTEGIQDDLKRDLRDAYELTNGTMENITRSTARACYTEFFTACDDAFMRIQAGVSPQKAIAEAVRSLIDRGITVVTYTNSNKRNRVETAVALAVRTGVNMAWSNSVLHAMAAKGEIYVSVSQHIGARVTPRLDYTNHYHWQGKVYMINWNDPTLARYKTEQTDELVRQRYGENPPHRPDFIEECGYGRIQGIAGINCRHSFGSGSPYMEDETPIDEELNERMYRLEQQQRAMERRMRRMLQRKECLKAIEPKDDKLKDQLKALNRDIKAYGQQYVDFCNEHGLNMRYDNIRF